MSNFWRYFFMYTGTTKIWIFFFENIVASAVRNEKLNKMKLNFFWKDAEETFVMKNSFFFRASQILRFEYTTYGSPNAGLGI